MSEDTWDAENIGAAARPLLGSFPQDGLPEVEGEPGAPGESLRDPLAMRMFVLLGVAACLLFTAGILYALLS